MKINKVIIIDIVNNIDNLSNLNLTNKEKINYLILLHDIGIIKYTKLTSENYYFWWCEVDISKSKPNKNVFSISLNNFIITQKGRMFKKIIDHKSLKNLNFYSIYNIVDQLLNDNKYLIKHINLITNKELI